MIRDSEGRGSSMIRQEELFRRVRDYLFFEKKTGLIDLHQRAYDEPPGNGGFLKNGGRLYIDMGHVEYASPECGTIHDMVAMDRAGDLLLEDALREIIPEELHRASGPWEEVFPPATRPFLTTFHPKAPGQSALSNVAGFHRTTPGEKGPPWRIDRLLPKEHRESEEEPQCLQMPPSIWEQCRTGRVAQCLRQKQNAGNLRHEPYSGAVPSPFPNQPDGRSLPWQSDHIPRRVSDSAGGKWRAKFLL